MLTENEKFSNFNSSPGNCWERTLKRDCPPKRFWLSSVQVSEMLAIGFLRVVIFVLVLSHFYFVMFKIASERFDGYQEGTIVPSNAKFVCWPEDCKDFKELPISNGTLKTAIYLGHSWHKGYTITMDPLCVVWKCILSSLCIEQL